MTSRFLFRATRGRPAPVWGDGFVEDGWSDLLAVRSWSDVDPDQSLRLFPQLVPADGRVAGHVAAALEACVASRGLRHGDAAGAPGASGVRSHFAGAGAGLRAPSRAVSKALDVWRGAFGAPPAAPRTPDDRSADHFLAGVLGQLRDTGRVAPDPARTALFAYLTGLHPAYLWPEAIATHERDTAAGWLGVVARGRAALMPLEVADYFADVIVCRGGRYAVRDGQIAPLARSSVCPKRILKAAALRRAGRSLVVHPLRAGAARGWAGEGTERSGRKVADIWPPRRHPAAIAPSAGSRPAA